MTAIDSHNDNNRSLVFGGHGLIIWLWISTVTAADLP